MADEENLFRLTVGGFSGGEAGDALAYHDGMAFTTFDRDQDQGNFNCAQILHGWAMVEEEEKRIP